MLVFVWYRAPRHGETFWRFFGEHALEYSAIVLAVSGTSYAVVHERELLDASTTLNDIEKSLSTHRVRSAISRKNKSARQGCQISRYSGRFLDYGSFLSPRSTVGCTIGFVA